MSATLASLGRTRHGDVAVYAASVALVAGAYYATGRVGLELAYLDGAVAAIWPPAGWAWPCSSSTARGCGPAS